MTVQVSDAHAHVQRLHSLDKLATVLEDYITKVKRSVVRFLWAKGLIAKDTHIEMFPACGEKCLRVKQFATGSRNSLKDVRNSQMMPDQVRKWL
jgi:hypothetical protein